MYTRTVYVLTIICCVLYVHIFEQKESGNAVIMRRLKQSMVKIGLNPDLLDDPEYVLPNQPGHIDEEVRTEPFEKVQ